MSNTRPSSDSMTPSNRGAAPSFPRTGRKGRVCAGSARDVVERVGVRARALVLVQRRDVGHVGVGELEVEELEVLLHALAGDRLREDDVAALDVPAEGDLRGRALEPVRDADEHRILQHVALRDRRPRLGGDAVLPVEVPHVVLRQVRVDLDLVGGRDHGRLGEEPVEVVLLEVRDADRPDLAALVHLLHRLPRLDEVADARQRPVHEEEVDVAEVERLEALLEGAGSGVGVVEAVVQLARDEDLATVDPGGTDGLADLLLVAVHLGGVDVAVADLEGRERRVLRLLGLDLEDAEPELGDLDAVVQRDGGNCSRRSHASRLGRARWAVAGRRLDTGYASGRRSTVSARWSESPSPEIRTPAMSYRSGTRK